MEYYVTQPKDYWIAPNAVSITLNAMGEKNRIQGSVASGAVIMCFIEDIKAESAGGEPGNGDGLWYGANHEPKRWPLSLSPTYFNSDSRKYVYVAIPRSTTVGTQAVIVFPSEKLDIYGRALRLTDDSSDDRSDDSSGDEQYVQVGSTDYFYVYLQGIIGAADAVVTGERRWEDAISDRDWGILETAQGRDEQQTSSEWYTYSTNNQTVTFLKKIFMSAGSWFQNLIIGSGTTQGTLTGVATDDNASSIPQDSKQHIVTPSYLDKFGNTHYLSKVDEDTAKEQIGFLKGLWVKTKGLFGIAADGAAKVYSLLVNGLWGIDSNGDVTAHNMTAAQLIASILKSPDFVEAVGMIGNGFGVTVDANGKAKVQTNDLIVLGRMIVNSLNIREVTYIGGTYLLTPAGSTIAKVQKLYGSSASDTRTWTTSGSGTVVGYRLMWKADDGTTGTMNYWHQGDQAFCQTYNVTEAGEYEDASNRRYWRLVCRVGQTTESGVVWHYADLANVYTAFLYDKNGNPVYNEGGGTGFAGYENANGDEPAAGDKVVCLGSQSDTTRQGAVQITAEGTASFGIYDNINNYAALSTHEIHYFSKEDVRMTARRFKWTTASGDSVPPTVYRGTWTQGKVSAWGDEWTYNGSNWICVYTGTSPLNITEAPGTTAAYWVENKGQKGDPGDSITKVSEVAYYIKNTTGVRPVADDPSWSTTKPALSEGEWLFTKTVITWSDGSTTLLFTDERNPNDGVNGQDIVVDGSTEVKYYVGSSNTTHPAENSSEWKDLSQVVQTQGMWLWSKSTTNFKKYNSSEGSHDAGKSVVYNVSYIAEDGGLGRGIVSVTEFYKANNSTTAPAVDDSQWDTDPNLSHQTDKWDANHKYLWNYERVEYSSGTRYERTTPQIVAIFTEDGDSGRGIDSITNYYCVTNSNEAPPRQGESGAPTWYLTPQIPGQGQYLWNYEVITWINPSGTTMTDVQMIGYAGENGTTPVKGVDYFDGNDAYSINVTPASIILNQNLNDASDYGLPRTFTISVVAGSTAKTFKVNAPSGTGLTVSRDNSYSRTEHVITLSGVSSSVSSSEISVTLTDIEGMTGTKTIKIPVFVNQLGSWTQTIENGVSTEVGRQIEYGLQDVGVIKTSYDAAITKSAQGLTQEFTEEISKALGTGERNLFGFHKGCKMETSNWFCVPFIQGYGVIINTSVNSYRRGRISNLGLEGQGGYFVVTFQIKLSSGSGAVNVNVCDVEATKGKGSISASAANTNISVNTSWQSYELHFYLADNTPYMDAESYNGFIDFEAQYSSNYDIYVRHLKIERGDEATEFVEADEDISYTGRAQLLGPLTLKSGVSTGITYTDSKNVSKTCNRYYYSGSSSSTPEWDEVISAKVTQDLVAGRVYTLSYWATSYNSYSNVPKIHNLFSLLNGAAIITDISSERYDEGAGGISEGVTSNGLTLITLKHREWVRYFVRFYVTNTVSVSDIRHLVALTIYKNYNSSWYGYIYMTDIVLQEGYAMEPTRYSSLMEQSARRISLSVSDGLSRTGIDIEAGKISCLTDDFEVRNSDGEKTLGLNSDGDFEVGGTVKARDFFHKCVTWWPSNNYSVRQRQYIGTTNSFFTHGRIYDQSYLDSLEVSNPAAYADYQTDTSARFIECTGTADVVNITTNTSSDIQDPIYLPDPRYCHGKRIEMFTYNFQGTERDFNVSSVAAFNGVYGYECFTFAVYPNSEQKLISGDLAMEKVLQLGHHYTFISTEISAVGSATKWIWWVIKTK